MPELDIQTILRELVDGGVEFLLIGGVAVGYHGHIRATKDVDVVPDPETANLERLARVLQALEAQVEGADEFAAGELPDPLDPSASELGGNWIGDAPLWTQLAPSAIEDHIAGLPIKIVSFDDLVRLKEMAGRPEDLADLQRLREAREG